MEFYTCFDRKRPVRLDDATRAFAWESLHGKYGQEAVRNGAIAMDGEEGFAALPPLAQYDLCIRRIAERAPLRLVPGEHICGAATLGAAMTHHVPATLGGEPVFYSVSHVTLGFDRVLTLGMDGIAQEVRSCLNNPDFTPEQRALDESLLSAIESMRIWHGRYLEAIGETQPEMRARLKRVPFAPAQDFRQALQSLWFTFAFVRLCGNWPGIGRIDQMLGKYLEADLKRGAITLEEAREWLAHFFIKGCEWIEKDTAVGSGDAQHYQNLVLAGVDEEGKEVANEVTYLILDVVEELGISDFPITVRVNPRTPERLLTRVAQVMRHGGGVLAVYNEDLILDSLAQHGYPLKEARRFANDGCWEVQIPGRTNFIYLPLDALRALLIDTLHLDGEPAHFDSMAQLYAAYDAAMRRVVEDACDRTLRDRLDGDGNFRKKQPCSVVSLLEEGCAQRGRSYHEGGPIYTVVSPHIGGAPDVGNSLYAIDRLVFQEKRVGFDELMRVLQRNWEGAEALRQYALNRITYYGNDCDEADAYTVRVLNDFAGMTKKYDGGPIRFPTGVSTFGRQIEWAPFRAATPSGRRKGDVLSGNASPTPGTDAQGATAVIRSFCKADLKRQVTGAALDVKLHLSAVRGEEGVAALIALIRGFVALGGYFMQLDVMDAEALRAAQRDPETYKTLSVRVSGWNARFVTLDKQWQDMVIARTAQEI